MNKSEFLTMAFENGMTYTARQCDILENIKKEVTDPVNVQSVRLFAQATVRLLAEYLVQTAGADVVEAENTAGNSVYVA